MNQSSSRLVLKLLESPSFNSEAAEERLSHPLDAFCSDHSGIGTRYWQFMATQVEEIVTQPDHQMR